MGIDPFDLGPPDIRPVGDCLPCGESPSPIVAYYPSQQTVVACRDAVVVVQGYAGDRIDEYAVFLRDSGRYIGNVGLINMDHTHHHADISYYMDHAVTGQGYATEAAAAMLQYGFLTLGFHKINGVCMHKNGASRRVMEKIGMRYEGTLREDLYKDGVYYDLDRLSILDEEYYTLCKAEKTSFQHLNVESV